MITTGTDINTRPLPQFFQLLRTAADGPRIGRLVRLSVATIRTNYVASEG